MRKFLVVFLFLSGSAFAQELDSLQTDTIPKPPPKHLIGGYVFAGVTGSPGPVDRSTLPTVGLGVRYDKFEAGASFSAFTNDYVKRLVFPNFFSLIYAQGGAYFAYNFFESDILHVAPMVMLQVGDIVWERDDTKVDFASDRFKLWQIGLKVETPYLRYVRPEIVLGYQHMSEIVVPQLGRENFTGFFMGFNVKVGYFNQ
ncbi:MAG: hypothetical protein ABJP45_10560 [Cyclobacteriaceae bacterium]